MECKNCDQKLNEGDQFCSRCGQQVIRQRLSLKQILTDLLHIITNLERGLFFTVRELALHPYKVINEFISGKTKPYYGPLRFLILWVTVSVVVNISLGLFDQQQSTMTKFFMDPGDEELRAQQQKISDFFKKYANIVPLLIIPFNSLMSKWLLRKRGMNYAEHLVMNAYLSGFTSILGVVYLLFFWGFSIPVFKGLMFTTLINYAYYCWTVKHLFSYKWIGTLLRSGLVLFFGFILFSLFSGISGILISLIFLR